MSIVLSPDVERQIEEMVRSGRFQSADDCIRKSVQLMREHDDEWKKSRDKIERLVEEGARDLEEGRYTEYDAKSLREFIEEIKREGRASRRARAEHE